MRCGVSVRCSAARKTPSPPSPATSTTSSGRCSRTAVGQRWSTAAALGRARNCLPLRSGCCCTSGSCKTRDRQFCFAGYASLIFFCFCCGGDFSPVPSSGKGIDGCFILAASLHGLDQAKPRNGWSEDFAVFLLCCALISRLFLPFLLLTADYRGSRERRHDDQDRG